METQTQAQTQAQTLTSEKLTKLTADYSSAWAEMLKCSDPLSEAAKNAKLALYKIEAEINAEKSALTKAENERKLDEMRNERLKLNETQLKCFESFILAKSDKKLPAEKLAEIEAKFFEAKNVIDNELLARFASSTPGKKSVKNEGGGSQSEKSAQILQMYEAKKSHAEIEAETGVPRSTIWHTINNAIKAGTVAKWH